jgi:hypothetical protein
MVLSLGFMTHIVTIISILPGGIFYALTDVEDFKENDLK